MDYYDSTQVPKGGGTMSGNGVGFNSIGGIPTISIQGMRGAFFIPDKNSTSSSHSSTYTLQICVDGNPMNLDVLVSGDPYPIS